MKNVFVFDKDNLDIPYLLGLYLTDGYVMPKGKHFRLRVIDEDLCNEVANISMKLFGNSLSVRKCNYPGCTLGYCFETMIASESLCTWLIEETGKKKHLPEWIYEMPDDWKRALIAGCIDGDGYISASERRYKNNPTGNLNWVAEIGLCGKCGTYIDNMSRLFSTMNIQYSVCDKTDKRPSHTAVMKVFNILPHSFIDNNLYVKCFRKIAKLDLIKKYNIGYKSYKRSTKNPYDVQRLDAQLQAIG